jgi:hypothetical protein
VRLSRLPFLVVALAVAALAVPAAAQAANLPSTGQPFLVPGEQIGGVFLHTRIIKGKQAWGGSRGTCNDFYCDFQDPRHPDLGDAQFNFEDGPRGKITNIAIAVGRDPRTGKPVFRTPLTAFRSPTGGIHLGSSMRAVKAAYPKAKAVRGAPDYLSMFDSQRDQTLFNFENHRLTRVIMQDDRPRG